MIEPRYEKAVLIHGWKEGKTDPLTQLDSIGRQLEAVSLSTVPFDWGTEHGFWDSYNLLRQGKFADTLSQEFDDWLQTNSRDVGYRRLIIIAYSLGGLIFYKWAVDHRTRDADREKIALAVTIASPYQCSLGKVDIEADMPDGKQRILRLGNINEPGITCSDIVESLPSGTLKVLLAGKDVTALRPDSMFAHAYRTRVEQHRCKFSKNI